MSDLKATHVDANNVIVTYAAVVDGTCDGKKVPPRYYKTDLYTLRNGQWFGTMHTEAIAAKAVTSK